MMYAVAMLARTTSDNMAFATSSERRRSNSAPTSSGTLTAAASTRMAVTSSVENVSKDSV